MFVCNLVLISFAISPAVGVSIKNLTSRTSDRNLTEVTFSHWRPKRQEDCGLYQWRCADGTCIPVTKKCDIRFDCPDKSDEKVALCRDKSGVFPCPDGNLIPAWKACDGIPDCTDGRDETEGACLHNGCPVTSFQCAYGACVDHGSDCNGINDCADGSDESEDLCNKFLLAITEPAVINTPAPPGYCVLPPYPDHGRYVVTNSPQSRPGQSLPFALINVTCDEGYGVIGNTLVYCEDGNSQLIPKCIRQCKLEPHDSVQYNCILLVGDGTRPCNQYEPPGTTIEPQCKPNYFLNDRFYMKCNENGDWNHIAKCKPECGRVTPSEGTLIFGGTTATRGELPWYVAIYRKPTVKRNFHDLICGGTIISNSVVLSAAHCFWDNFGEADPSLFAVATAKLFREWDNENDTDVQKSNLTSIYIPDHYFGASANFQHDIAILILESPFVYHNYVRRVCLDFSQTFSDLQLQEGNLGKVAGFGLTTAEASMGSPILKAVSVPYVPIKQCRKLTPDSFAENLSGDKICAGYSDGTAALCKGDSGGGLSFPAQERGAIRYYLRGIVSTAPRVEDACNTYTVISFTSIINHERFINKYL